MQPLWKQWPQGVRTHAPSGARQMGQSSRPVLSTAAFLRAPQGEGLTDRAQRPGGKEATGGAAASPPRLSL